MLWPALSEQQEADEMLWPVLSEPLVHTDMPCRMHMLLVSAVKTQAARSILQIKESTHAEVRLNFKPQQVDMLLSQTWCHHHLSRP